MNGFTSRGLDEGQFDEPKGIAVVKAFDAFPKTKRTYLTHTQSGGGVLTILLVLTCLFLTWTEVDRWFTGNTTHTFTVEKGVGHEMQINLDIIVAMECQDLHVNVQDATGDRILATERLTMDPTTWDYWTPQSKKDRDEMHPLLRQWREQKEQYLHETDVHDFLKASLGSKKFPKTPKVKGNVAANSCRIYGILEGNKVQGDFHVTARGHGYQGEGVHLDHGKFNFSHHINELSFGPHMPTLRNPLDHTHTTTNAHFYKYQYYVNVVPSIYTTDISGLDNLENTAPPTIDDPKHHENIFLDPLKHFIWTVYTNQYAATEQSHSVPETQAPGVFIKYDIEPILLLVAEEQAEPLALFIRCVNVISGVLVAGGWIVSLLDWMLEIWGRRRRGAGMMGMLSGGDKAALD